VVKREKECGLKEKRRKEAKEGRLRGQRMQHGLNSRLTAGPQNNGIISFSLLIS